MCAVAALRFDSFARHRSELVETSEVALDLVEAHPGGRTGVGGSRQQLRSAWIAVREERERSPVVALGLRMVQANCTVAGERAEANGRIDDRVGLIHSARCASELEC